MNQCQHMKWHTEKFPPTNQKPGTLVLCVKAWICTFIGFSAINNGQKMGGAQGAGEPGDLRGGREAAAAVVMAAVANGLWERTVGTQWCCCHSFFQQEAVQPPLHTAMQPLMTLLMTACQKEHVISKLCLVVEEGECFFLFIYLFYPLWPALQCRRGPVRWTRLGSLIQTWSQH